MRYLTIITLVFILNSCINVNSQKGSGHVITEKRIVQPFLAIHAERMVHVEIIKSDVQSVTVEADDNIMPFVDTKVVGNTLKITLKGINNLNNATINIKVTTQELNEIYASTSAEITSNDTLNSAQKIVLKASTSGSISLNVIAPIIDAYASSSGELEIGGRTKDVTAEANTSGSMDLYDLKAENVIANVSTSGDISVFASVSMNGTANTSGSISYQGGATSVVKNENTSGSVTPE